MRKSINIIQSICAQSTNEPKNFLGMKVAIRLPIDAGRRSQQKHCKMGDGEIEQGICFEFLLHKLPQNDDACPNQTFAFFLFCASFGSPSPGIYHIAQLYRFLLSHMIFAYSPPSPRPSFVVSSYRQPSSIGFKTRVENTVL